MSGKEPDRKPSSAGRAAAVVLACCFVAVPPARAGDLWDTVMQKMNLKAAPAAPGPDFVERTRPDPGNLGYLPTALPHRVSPLPVKSAVEIEAQKAALDAAAKRQRDPVPAKPLDLARAKKAAKGAAAVAD